MKLSRFVAGAAVLGVGALIYGALFETDKLRTVRKRIRLPWWPREKDGFRVAVLSDFHVRDMPSVALTQRAVAMALAESPDVVLIPGDFIAYWKRGVLDLLDTALSGLAGFSGPVIAVPGNHDSFAGDPDWLRIVLEKYDIQMLRNQCVKCEGVNWIGIDSVLSGHADPYSAISQADPGMPMVALWHEPDAVEALPKGIDLMVAGHSHGGQFLAPWGWAPGTSELGRKHLGGWYPAANVPLYVTRGVGTTGPPSRLFCPPEVTVLSLYSDA